MFSDCSSFDILAHKVCVFHSPLLFLVPKNAIKQSIISTLFSLLIVTWTGEIFVLSKIIWMVNQVRLK